MASGVTSALFRDMLPSCVAIAERRVNDPHSFWPFESERATVANAVESRQSEFRPHVRAPDERSPTSGSLPSPSCRATVGNRCGHLGWSGA